MNIIIPKIPERTIPLPKINELVSGLVLLLLARAKLPGMEPFGLAFAAAMPAGSAIIGLAALCIGTAGAEIIKYTIAFLIYNILIYIHKSEDSYAKSAALAISLVTAGGISLLVKGATPAQVILLIPEAMLSVCVYRIFTHTGERNELGDIALAVIAGGILNGTKGVNIPYINAEIAVVAAFFAVMSLCYACRMSWAVLMSGVLGFIMYANGADAVIAAGSFVVAAVFSSMLAHMGKAGAAVGFLCGITVSALYIGKINYALAEIFVPIGVFVLLPESAHRWLGDRITGGEEIPDSNVRIAEQLNTVAKAVSGLAEGVTVPQGGEREEAVKREMVEIISKRVCAGCSLEDSCKKKDRRSTYNNICQLWSAMEQEGFCDYSNMPQTFFQTCMRSERFLREFNHMYELYKQNVLYKGEALSGRDIIARQYMQISGVIRNLSREVESGCVTEALPAAEYQVSVTYEQEAKRGQSVCGDSLVHFEAGGKYYVILCDGMGSGEGALSESRLTARLFSEFLKAGFKKETALDMINSALALKAEQESFSTVDLLEIELETGVAEFLKIGSAQSFLKTKGNIEVITSKALPVGILENIEVTPQSYQLRNNDVILMVSDGVGEADSGVLKNDWLKRLMLMENRSDRELVQLVLVGAKARMKFSDDITGVVVRVKKRRGETE